MSYVLDTNIITAILKGNHKVLQRAQEALSTGTEVLINCISYYEIKRGLLAVKATKKLEKFDLFCRTFGLLLFDTLTIFDEGATIYADLKKQGRLIEDADILIASLVKAKNYVLVSNDTHFTRIKDLKIENWLIN